MLSDMLNALKELLQELFPEATPSLPTPSISVVRVTERSVGLGNQVGVEVKGSFQVAVVKGTRLDAVVRFQVQRDQLDEVNTAIAALHDRLATQKNKLRQLGFLRFAALETSTAELNPTLDVWTKTIDYTVLYEFRFLDSEGAESLIARIPITLTGEVEDSTVITDRMVRWDDQSAPTLIVRGRSQIRQLSGLAFIPGAIPSGSITLTRTFDGAAGEPTNYPTLAAFQAAIASSSPGDRHGQVVFPSLTAFLDAFGPAGEATTLGDWNEDGVPDLYQSRVLTFEPVISLASASDRLEITHAGNPLSEVAVVYLQAT